MNEIQNKNGKLLRTTSIENLNEIISQTETIMSSNDDSMEIINGDKTVTGSISNMRDMIRNYTDEKSEIFDLYDVDSNSLRIHELLDLLSENGVNRKVKSKINDDLLIPLMNELSRMERTNTYIKKINDTDTSTYDNKSIFKQISDLRDGVSNLYDTVFEVANGTLLNDDELNSLTVSCLSVRTELQEILDTQQLIQNNDYNVITGTTFPNYNNENINNVNSTILDTISNMDINYFKQSELLGNLGILEGRNMTADYVDVGIYVPGLTFTSEQMSRDVGDTIYISIPGEPRDLGTSKIITHGNFKTKYRYSISSTIVNEMGNKIWNNGYTEIKFEDDFNMKANESIYLYNYDRVVEIRFSVDTTISTNEILVFQGDMSSYQRWVLYDGVTSIDSTFDLSLNSNYDESEMEAGYSWRNIGNIISNPNLIYEMKITSISTYYDYISYAFTLVGTIYNEDIEKKILVRNKLDMCEHDVAYELVIGSQWKYHIDTFTVIYGKITLPDGVNPEHIKHIHIKYLNGAYDVIDIKRYYNTPRYYIQNNEYRDLDGQVVEVRYVTSM
jgi:hypothetical protein